MLEIYAETTKTDRKRAYCYLSKVGTQMHMKQPVQGIVHVCYRYGNRSRPAREAQQDRIKSDVFSLTTDTQQG